MSPPSAEAVWALTLYIDGASFQSLRAVEVLQEIFAGEPAGRVDLEVVDVRADPSAGHEDRVIVLPTLVKRRPAPACRVVGDLSDSHELRARLGLSPDGPTIDTLSRSIQE